MSTLRSMLELKSLLVADAAACAGMGLVLLSLANPLVGMTLIPEPILFWAGAALIPIAAFMIAVSRLKVIPAWAVGVVVGGNALWVIASFLLPILGLIAPNAFGYVLLLGQAAAVSVLALLEWHAARTLVPAN